MLDKRKPFGFPFLDKSSAIKKETGKRKEEGREAPSKMRVL
jgi:hypothetical protein